MPPSCPVQGIIRVPFALSGIMLKCISCWLLSLWPDEKVFPRGIKTQGLKIHQRFHFASALKRMSVLASYDKMGSTELSYISAVKGAPETLRPMVFTLSLIHALLFSTLFNMIHWCSNVAVFAVFSLSGELRQSPQGNVPGRGQSAGPGL